MNQFVATAAATKVYPLKAEVVLFSSLYSIQVGCARILWYKWVNKQVDTTHRLIEYSRLFQSISIYRWVQLCALRRIWIHCDRPRHHAYMQDDGDHAHTWLDWLTSWVARRRRRRRRRWTWLPHVNTTHHRCCRCFLTSPFCSSLQVSWFPSVFSLFLFLSCSYSLALDRSIRASCGGGLQLCSTCSFANTQCFLPSLLSATR